MRDLIGRPHDPLTAAHQAAVYVTARITLPCSGAILAVLLVRIGPNRVLLVMAGWCLAGALVLALVAGLGRAAWSLVELWAYDRALEQPPED